MSMPVIGIIGGSGAVGSAAINLLIEKYRIRSGQRHLPKLSSNQPGLNWQKVDIFNPPTLADFCRGCDVVLNCAGPSYKIIGRIADAANDAGAAYVDVFGGDPLEAYLSKNNNKGVFVISAGVFPGLSGLFPLWLKEQEFDQVGVVRVFAGGREILTQNAGADLLLSSLDGFGTPDAYWDQGEIIPHSKIPDSKVQLKGFGRVLIQPFFHTEMIRLAKKLDINQAYWYNVILEKNMADLLTEGCMQLAKNRSDAALAVAVTKLVNLASALASGMRPWYHMMLDMEGIKQGQTIKKRAVLRSESSYKLTAMVAACAVERICEQQPNEGIYWAFDFLNSQDLMKRLVQERFIDHINIVDIDTVAVEFDDRKLVKGSI